MPQLPLHKVLEEEYASMYGPLPAPAPGRKISTDEEKLAYVYEQIHKRGDRTALCISGGGIRTATFALGVIQGLASAGILRKFDYLSTVSGGGFIGSWLSSWIRRHPEGVAGVEAELRQTDVGVANHQPHPDAGMVMPSRAALPVKIDPEPSPVRHLRDYSNYLSPKLGILSGDTWTMASLYIRNLLLNLLVLIPILACVLAIPRLFSWGLELAQHGRVPIVAWPWIATFFLTMGFAYLGQTRPVEQGGGSAKQKKVKLSDGHFMLWCILPLIAAGTALAIFWARVQPLKAGGPYDPALTDPSTIAAAVVAGVFGMMLFPYILYYRRFDRATTAALRAEFKTDAVLRSARRRKKAREFIAVLFAVATTAALLLLLAVKIFPDPLRVTPNLADLSPLQRFGVPASPQAQLFVCFSVPAVLLVFFIQASIFVGISGKRNEDYDREWWGRAGAWLLFYSVALGLLCFIAVFGPVALYQAPVILGSIGGGAGLAAALLGFSNKTPATQKQKEEGGKTAAAGSIASALVVPLFVVFLLAAISLGTTWLIHRFRNLEVDTKSATLTKKAAQQFEYTETTTTNVAGVVQEQKTKIPAAPLTSIPALQGAAHLLTIQTTTGWELLGILGLGGLAFALSFSIGVNKFSMAALYRNRLIRAYLGASRGDERDPDPFTGFDANDNLQMWQLRPELIAAANIPDLPGFVNALRQSKFWNSLDARTKADPVDPAFVLQNVNDLIMNGDLCSVAEVPEWIKDKAGYSQQFRNRAMLDHHFAQWIRGMAAPKGVTPTPPLAEKPLPRLKAQAPIHVINTCLNLTTGDDLAWQQRQAESMTVSPFHCGNVRLGYRPAQQYGGDDGISIGTAVGISGAAASPNMGYHSSPLMAFLLTFFNIRLGSWLGNPGAAGEDSYAKAHPSTNLKPMLDELTGSSNDKSPWVYLSDGGHFENLGLYEMIVRRCRYIVVSDGGCDPKFSFEDLGNAIRKIRVDFGVPIEFEDKMEMSARPSDGTLKTGRYVARATVRYKTVDGETAQDGTLIYIKSSIYDEPTCPRDVYNYAQESLLFPHEPTSDQFFSESQFESYRALGRHAVNQVCGNYPAPTAHERIPIAKTFENVTSFFTIAEKNTGPFPTKQL